MRVAIDYTAAVNQTAGIGRFVRSLVAALAEIDSINYYLLLYALPNNGRFTSFPTASNFTRRPLRFSQRWLDIIWHRLSLPLPVNLATGPIDIFHSLDFVLPPVRSAATVLTVHDLAFLLYPECADSHLRNYLEKTVPRSVTRADFVVADSENTRNDVICLLGARPERVEVVPGGVDPMFRPIEDRSILADLRQRLGLGDYPFILSVGLIEPRKNLLILLEAYRVLRDRGRVTEHLLIVGRPGWLSGDVFEQAERSPYRDDIHFVGFVADDDLPALYSSASVFAFPSLYEGFGLPPLEAMACGAPVVVSQTSSLPEVVAEAGLQVDPRDADGLAAALELLILDETLRAELRRRGLARAQIFNWQSAAKKLLSVYRGLGVGVE